MKWKLIGNTFDEITHSDVKVYECSNCKSRATITSPICFFCKEVSDDAKADNHRDEAGVGLI